MSYKDAIDNESIKIIEQSVIDINSRINDLNSMDYVLMISNIIVTILIEVNIIILHKAYLDWRKYSEGELVKDETFVNTPKFNEFLIVSILLFVMPYPQLNSIYY